MKRFQEDEIEMKLEMKANSSGNESIRQMKKRVSRHWDIADPIKKI